MIAANDDHSGTNAAPIGMIQARVASDFSKITSAPDYCTVQQYGGEVTTLMSMYTNFFRTSDPGYDDAFRWANGILTQRNILVSQALARLGF